MDRAGDSTNPQILPGNRNFRDRRPHDPQPLKYRIKCARSCKMTAQDRCAALRGTISANRDALSEMTRH